MQRLSGLDASFLYMETPTTPMHVAMTVVLDPSTVAGGYTFDRVVGFIEERLHLVPLFRRRLLDVPFKLHHPVWVEDPDFDIIHHVRRVACPAPGGRRELAALAGRITSTPLDRSRPLWEAWVIEELEGGHVAVVVKVHHCTVDGVTGAGLMEHLFDLRPSGRDIEPPTPPTPSALPGEMDLLRDAILARLRQPLEMVRLAGRTVQQLRDMVRVRMDAGLPDGATPLTAPRTRFNQRVTARRDVAFARVPLEGIKTIKNATGAKVNDVVLAITAGALRRYLDGHGELPVEPLIAVCPISVRPKRDDQPAAHGELTNRVSAMFTSLATDVVAPLPRLHAIQDVTKGAKEEHAAIGAETLMSWAEYAFGTTFNLAVRAYTRLRMAERFRPIYNVVTSNVPGPPIPIYFAGARLVAAYPMGPVLQDAGLNVTVMSYTGQVDFGFMVARNLLPDVWALAEQVEPAFEELIAAVGPVA